MIHDARKTPSADEQRKKMLIAQGALYRLGISESKLAVRANLQLDTLAKNAISHLIANASGAFGTLFSLKNFRSGNVQALLPVLISSISFLSKRRILLRPALIGAATLAAAGALAFFIARKKKRMQPDVVDADEPQHRRPS
jgi:hypothetical protein